MADYALDETITTVDTRSMRETAASVEKNLEAISAAKQELRSICKMLEGASGWLGSAGEAYVAALSSLIKNVESASKEYASLPKDIIRYAEDYERADGIAMAVAESIETATWAVV